jgi:hypothetical protein
LQRTSNGLGLTSVALRLFRLKAWQLLLVLDGERSLIHLLVGYMFDYLLLSGLHGPLQVLHRVVAILCCLLDLPLGVQVGRRRDKWLSR